MQPHAVKIKKEASRGNEACCQRKEKMKGIDISSYYYVPRPETEATISLMNRIDEIFTDNLDYGSRMLRKVLRQDDGLGVNRK